MVDRADRLNNLRRKYSGFSTISKKGAYRRIHISGVDLQMLEELKRLNPKVSYDDLVAHAISVALDVYENVPTDDGDDTTRTRVEHILSMHGYDLDSWCRYHGFPKVEVTRKMLRIDRQFNLFGSGKDVLKDEQEYNESGRPLCMHKYERAFLEDFGLDMRRLVCNDVIYRPGIGKIDNSEEDEEVL